MEKCRMHRIILKRAGRTQCETSRGGAREENIWSHEFRSESFLRRRPAVVAVRLKRALERARILRFLLYRAEKIS
jgi:hypothetical protein